MTIGAGVGIHGERLSASSMEHGGEEESTEYGGGGGGGDVSRNEYILRPSEDYRDESVNNFV